MPTIKHKKADFVFPANAPANKEDLVRQIKQAEKGPFYTSAEMKEAVKEWSKKYSR